MAVYSSVFMVGVYEVGGNRCPLLGKYEEFGEEYTACSDSLAQERRRASSVSVGGRMFVTGGYLPGRGSFTTSEVWTSRRGWRPGGASLELSPGRDGHCSVALGSQGVVITGGWGAETLVQHINISSKDRLSHDTIYNFMKYFI